MSVYKPYGNFILVQLMPVNEKIGSIIVEKKSHSREQIGLVHSVGNSVTDFNTGDVVCWENGKFQIIPKSISFEDFGEKEMAIVNQKDIYMVLDDCDLFK